LIKKIIIILNRTKRIDVQCHSYPVRDVETDQPQGPGQDVPVRNNLSWGMGAFESENCPQKVSSL
jgi:hypothetical protein